MVGKQGLNSAAIGKRNRNRVLMELLKSPLHFSGLKKKLRMSAPSLVGHLERLLEEGCLKRQVEGNKIVYVVVEEGKRQTVLDMRKDCWNELVLLVMDYNVCLTKDTLRKLRAALDDLKKSIAEKKQDVDVAARMMGIPETPIDKTFVGRLKFKTKKGNVK